MSSPYWWNKDDFDAVTRALRQFEANRAAIAETLQQAQANWAAVAETLQGVKLAQSAMPTIGETIVEAFRQVMATQTAWRSLYAEQMLAVLATESVTAVAAAEVEALQNELAPENDESGLLEAVGEQEPRIEGAVSRVTAAVAATGATIDPGAQTLIVVILLVGLVVGWEQALLLFIGVFAPEIRDTVNKTTGKNQDTAESDS